MRVPLPSPTENADAFVTQRLRTLSRTPGFVAGSAARQRLFAFYARGLTHDAIHEDFEGRAQLFAFRDPLAWFGGPCVIAHIDRPPALSLHAADADASLGFIAKALETHRDLLNAEDSDTLIEVAADDPPLLRLLLAHGFGIDSVVQVGTPATARARLPPTPLPAPLSMAPLTPDRVDPVISLHSATFTEHPEHCWFGARPQHLARMRATLLESPEGQFVLLADGQVRGHIGVDVDVDTPFWGTVGGLELVLDAELRGRGLARPIYSHLLDTLIARRCDTMKGGTSQPAVLHLGCALGRPWHSFNLRRATPFSPEHFLRFAPPPQQRLFGLTR